MAATRKQPNKHAVDLARVEGRYSVYRNLSRGFARAIYVASYGVPILALYKWIEPIAGRTTVVNGSLALSITGPSLALSAAVNVALFSKARSQRRRLKKQRQRAETIEARHGYPGDET
ncbi:MAG TPA: hypothetical protein VKB25_14030 [Conexibacter sp.]|nr:hypothetical protein [Conexibacter sp.]